MEEKRIVEYRRRESPAQESKFLWEVAFPVLAAALGTYLVIAAAFGDVAGKGAAGAVMLVMLLFRLYQWDQYAHGKHIVEHSTYREPDEPRREWAPVVRDRGDDGNGNRWRISGWYFSESEWRRLWRVLSAGTVTRDGLASVTLDNGNRMFPNTTARYSEYVSKLQQMGWVDGDNVVTDAARAWFGERQIAPPSNSA